MQVIERNSQRLRLKIGKLGKDRAMAAVMLFLSLISLVVMLSTPAQILTCRANPGQDAVNCEATQIRWWRSRRQFRLLDVEEVTLGQRQIAHPSGGRITDHYLRLKTSIGYQRIFPPRPYDMAGSLVGARRRATSLNQYLANPQAGPWVYRQSSRLAHAVLVSFMLLIGVASALKLKLRGPVIHLSDLDWATRQMVITRCYLTGWQSCSIYRLDDIAWVEVNQSHGQSGASHCALWIVLQSGDRFCLVQTRDACPSKYRTAELINGFLKRENTGTNP